MSRYRAVRKAYEEIKLPNGSWGEIRKLKMRRASYALQNLGIEKSRADQYALKGSRLGLTVQEIVYEVVR